MKEKLKILLIDVAELNEEEATNTTEKILSRTEGEIGTDEWLKTLTQGLADELTSLRVDKPGLKIGEIIRNLQK